VLCIVVLLTSDDGNIGVMTASLVTVIVTVMCGKAWPATDVADNDNCDGSIDCCCVCVFSGVTDGSDDWCEMTPDEPQLMTL